MINRVYQLSYLTRLLIDRTTCDKVTRLTDREGRGAGYGQEAFAFLILPFRDFYKNLDNGFFKNGLAE